MTVSGDWRSKLEEWLASTQEAPPPGIPPEIWQQVEADPSAGGLSDFEIQASLTALTQEVRLQGRAFKALDETLSPVKTSLETFQTAQDHLQQRLHDARREGEEKLIQSLVEAHDRLTLGLETALASRAGLPGARSWWLGGRQQWAAALEVVDSLVAGYRLGLEALEAQLQRSQVERLTCLGQPFDPHTMNAGAVEETDQSPEGTVLEVLRNGYLMREKLLRPAEVKVARKPKSMEDTQHG